MQLEEAIHNQPAVIPARAVWEESEHRFQTPEELDDQFFDPEDDPGGGGPRPVGHGIGPGTVVMALAHAGFRGPINPLCLQHLVEMARDNGVQWMVIQVYEDTGLTYLPNLKWWFGSAMLIGNEGSVR